MKHFPHNLRDAAKPKTEKPLTSLGRRNFLAAASVGAVAASSKLLTAQDYGDAAHPQRYPDPNVVVLDDQFKKYRLGNSAIRRVYHSKDMLWAEGP
ncbi:MAG: hypothetical protein VX520_01835, partial [Planctomycetota bacterium]|nr:hypothetical protein [Planctomycetota bacterium]